MLAVAARLGKTSVRPDPGRISGPVSESRRSFGRQSGLQSTRAVKGEGPGFGPGQGCKNEIGKQVLGKDGRGGCCKLAARAAQLGDAPPDLSAEVGAFMQQGVVFLQKFSLFQLTSRRDEAY